MPFRHEKAKVRKYTDKAAEMVFRGWRQLERKDPEYCKIGTAWDGVELVTVEIRWSDLEKISLVHLQEILFEACYQPLPKEMN
jgi:hypothetical protein